MKVGDIIYQFDSSGKIYADEIIDASLLYDKLVVYHTHSVDFDERAIETSIFTTKAEAQKYYKEHYEVNDNV